MRDEFHWSEFLPAFGAAAELAGFSALVLEETAAGPLMAWKRAGTGPLVYLSAGIHGDEPAGPMALLQLMREGFFQADLGWIICPALNPTGLAAGRRENAYGIDLNRDYWQRKSREVSAHAAWLENQEVPQRFLSLHEDWEATNFYLYEINLEADHPQWAMEMIKSVEPWFLPESGPEIDGHIPRAPGWIYHEAEADVPKGWPEAIFLAKRGCPLSFTFETPSHAPLATRIAAHCAAVRTACQQVFTAGNPHDEQEPMDAVFFDFDGVLVDTEWAIYDSWRRVFHAHDQDLPLEIYTRCIGSDFAHWSPKTHLEKMTGLHFDWESLDDRRQVEIMNDLAEVGAMHGASDWLWDLRRAGVPTAVVSSSSHRWVDGWLEKLGLAECFATTVCRGDALRIKPAPDLFEAAAQRLSVHPARCLVVEDSLNGTRAAKEAGMKVWAVPNRVTCGLDFSLADKVFPSLKECAAVWTQQTKRP